MKKKDLYLKSDSNFSIFFPKSWCSLKKKRSSLGIGLGICCFCPIINVYSVKNCTLFYVDTKIPDIRSYVGSVVEWLKHWAYDQHGLGSKPTRVILLCPWERHFTALSPAWWSWQAVLYYSHISIKLQADSNILASPEAGRSSFLPYVLAPPSLSYES